MDKAQRLQVAVQKSGRLTDADCDRDTLLVRGRPVGPVCHTGTSNCFDTSPAHRPGEFLHTLEAIIEQRIRNPPATSYTAATYARVVARMAQKVGEEGLEVALAAVQSDRRALVSESADLVFHLLLLLRAEGLSLADVTRELQSRHSAADCLAARANSIAIAATALTAAAA